MWEPAISELDGLFARWTWNCFSTAVQIRLANQNGNAKNAARDRQIIFGKVAKPRGRVRRNAAGDFFRERRRLEKDFLT
jgi:hypothetical protein